MRIALVHTKFDRKGGGEIYVVGLAAGLAARGHEVHLFGRRAAVVPTGTRFHRVPALPWGRAVKTWSFSRTTTRALRAAGFDVIQGFGKTVCQTFHQAGGGIHRAFLERTGVKSLSFYDRVVLALEDELFTSRSLRGIICPSAWVAREIERCYPASAGRIRIIPNGIDTKTFHPEGREADRRALQERFGLSGEAAILLFVATNFPLKGLDIAVAALPHLAGAHLIVVGGDRTARFEAQGVALGVADRIHFLGSQGDLPPLYRAADLLLHPTRYDSFANVCAEALACGTPVVTTDRAGASDLLRAGRGGIVLPGLPEVEGAAVAEAATRLLSRGVAARREARETALPLEQQLHVAHVEAFYREVCGEPGAAGGGR